MRIHLDEPNKFDGKFKELIHALSFSVDVEKNQKILNDLLSFDEKFIIFIDGEVERFAPLKRNKFFTESKNDLSYDDYTLFNLFTLDFKNSEVFYITPDYNINQNVKKIKELLGGKIKTNLNLLIHPYIFGFSEKSKYNNSRFSIDNYSFTINSKVITHKPKYNVVSLNCSKKPHRIKLIAELKDEDNFIYSYYPYEDEFQLDETYDDKINHGLLNELTELIEIYDMELFMDKNETNLVDRTKEEISKTFDSKHFAFQQSVPLEYIQSCVDLVTESYADESVMLTEKTYKPITLKKPFLLLSGRNSHKFLKEEGFELYEEIFDYSFDDKPFDIRYDSIIKQIKEILKIPTVEFSKICESFSEKINFNAEHKKEKSEYYNILYEFDDEQYVEFFKNFQKKYESTYK